MYVHMPDESPEYEPRREALTRGDVLFWVACFVAGWMTVVGVVGTLYHASVWLIGRLS